MATFNVSVQRDGTLGWAEVSIDTKKSVAAAKEIAMAKLPVVAHIDEVVLWKVDAVNSLIQLKDWCPVEEQLSHGDRVVVLIKPFEAKLIMHAIPTQGAQLTAP